MKKMQNKYVVKIKPESSFPRKLGGASSGSGPSPGKIVNGWANLAKTGKDENNGKEEKTSKDEVKPDKTEENNNRDMEKPKIVFGSKNITVQQDPQISKDEKLPFKVQFLTDPHPIIVLLCHALTQLVGTFEIVQK